MSRLPTVFVSEYVCGGAWPDNSLDNSLAAEGRTMLVALLRVLLSDDGGVFGANLARVGSRNAELGAKAAHVDSAFRTPHSAFVCTTWDDRPGEFPWREFSDAARNRLTVLPVARSTSASPAAELALFRREVAAADAVFVIAPEFHGILESRTREVEQLAPGRLIGCSSDAVRLCADKLELAEFLPAIGVPTIETHSFDLLQPTADWPFPIVIKPRDGAGSTLTFRIDSAKQLGDVAELLRASNDGFTFIQQPFVPGRSLSGAALISGTGSDRLVTVLPTGEQRLSDDRRFHYQGADIPGSVTPLDHQATEQIIRRCCAGIPGLDTCVGFDLIAGPDGVRLVEINPRLTTSWANRLSLPVSRRMSFPAAGCWLQ